MTVSSANFGTLLEPKLREVFFEKYHEIPEQYPRVYKVRGSKKGTETDFRIAGVGTWNEKGSMDSIAYEDIVAGDEVTYTHKEFAKGIQVERKLVDDEMYDVIDEMPKNLAVGLRATVETEGANIFNRAFNSSYLGYDSKVLCADDHPNRGNAGGTQDNKGTAALSDAELKTALIAMRAQKNENGLKIMVQAKQLIVPADLEYTAEEIINSTGKAGTADNDTNTVRGRLKVVVLDFLTDANNWFLRDPDVAQNIFFWRVRPEFKGAEEFDTMVAKYRGYARWSTGWSDWRGIWGASVA